jgi:hypothetical protein
LLSSARTAGTAIKMNAKRKGFVFDMETSIQVGLD